jgi:hypothetical protein
MWNSFWRAGGGGTGAQRSQIVLETERPTVIVARPSTTLQSNKMANFTLTTEVVKFKTYPEISIMKLSYNHGAMQMRRTSSKALVRPS